MCKYLIGLYCKASQVIVEYLYIAECVWVGVSYCSNKDVEMWYVNVVWKSDKRVGGGREGGVERKLKGLGLPNVFATWFCHMVLRKACLFLYY